VTHVENLSSNSQAYECILVNYTKKGKQNKFYTEKSDYKHCPRLSKVKGVGKLYIMFATIP